MGCYPFKRSPFVYKYVGVCVQVLPAFIHCADAHVKTGLVNRDVAEAWGEYFPWNLPACSHLSANIFHISLHKAATVPASLSIITSPGGRGFMKTTAFGIRLWFFFFFFNQHFCSCDFPNELLIGNANMTIGRICENTRSISMSAMTTGLCSGEIRFISRAALAETISAMSKNRQTICFFAF